MLRTYATGIRRRPEVVDVLRGSARERLSQFLDQVGSLDQISVLDALCVDNVLRPKRVAPSNPHDPPLR